MANDVVAQDFQIDPTRHFSIFSPQRFGDTRIDVIGAGATGSSIVLFLAKLGATNIHVWDFDTIESHNLSNQMYGPSHIGMAKVDALYEVVQYLTGTKIVPHNEKVTEDTDIPGKYVFLLVDSIAARREIADNCLDGNMSTQTCIETRMGVETGWVYTFNPNVPSELAAWKATLPESDDAAAVETSPCGTPITVGMQANLIASLAVWQFVRAVRHSWTPEDPDTEAAEFKVNIAVRPYIMQF